MERRETGCGTYEGCSSCRLKPDCCSDFLRIDDPVLSEKEIEAIENDGWENFYEKKDNGSYNIKTNQYGHCIFWMNPGCRIYDVRPADCRLYPYDIIKKDDKYYLILYKIDCIDEKYFMSDVQIKRIMPVVESVIPWIEQFTNEENFERLQSAQDYKVLKLINNGNGIQK